MTPERTKRIEMLMNSYKKHLDGRLASYDGELEWCHNRFERLTWELSVLPITDGLVQAYHEVWSEGGKDCNPCIKFDLILEFPHDYKLWLSISSAPYAEDDTPETIMYSIWKCHSSGNSQKELLVYDMMTIDEFMDTWSDVMIDFGKIDQEMDEYKARQE